MPSESPARTDTVAPVDTTKDQTSDTINKEFGTIVVAHDSESQHAQKNQAKSSAVVSGLKTASICTHLQKRIEHAFKKFCEQCFVVSG